MAKADLTVAVESAVHSAFAELAQSIADKHSIKVDRVSFDWWSSGPIVDGDEKLLVSQTNVDSRCKAGR